MAMHVVIDGEAMVPPLAGPGKYTQQLITSLLRIEPEHEYTVVYSRPLTGTCAGRFREFGLPEHPRLRPYCRERIEYRLWTMTGYSRLDRRIRADVYHGSGFIPVPSNRRPRVLTVHDVSMYRFPEGLHPRMERVKRALPANCRTAEAIITVSEYARQEIADTFGIPLNRIFVTYNGVDESFRPGPDGERSEIRREFTGGRPYLLHVGTLQPRKNVPALIRAFDSLHARGGFAHDLVLAGAWGWKYEAIEAAIANSRNRERIRVLAYVPANVLERLYRGADLLVLPSLYEGFGIPVVEAMASGLPVIASRAGAIPEVAGSAAILIDPLRAADELVDEIPRLIGDQELQSALIAQGLKRAAQFTWPATAAGTLDVYRSVST